MDLKTIDENLAKAKADVSFWETARNVFLDPRISGLLVNSKPAPSLPPAVPASTMPRPYGELKETVKKTLQARWGEKMTTSDIAKAMKDSGYVFVSKTPTIAVSGALESLGIKTCGMRGSSYLYKLDSPKDQEAPEGTS
jgi:hypothetical protein